MTRLMCRACEGDARVDVRCRCHGMHSSYQCGRCGNSGIDSRPCPICVDGFVSSWEEVKDGILWIRGDYAPHFYDDGPDPDDWRDMRMEEDF